MSEMPALAGDSVEGFQVPWRELSPSIGFLVAVALLLGGLMASDVILLAGVVLAPVSVVSAAILELQADRAAARAGGDPAAAAMLHASSDWPPRRRGR